VRLFHEVSIVFAYGREDVEHLGWFQGRCLVFDPTVDDEAVASMGIEDISCYIDADCATDYIDKLVVGMAVASTDPVSLEIMTHKH
jgi:hypothetical protein